MENTQVTDLPESETNEITVPVKFNKEIKELSLEDASTLAQKGLKFEAIEKDFATLKDLAAKENKSVPTFISELGARYNETKKKSLIEECGGNEEIAERILTLENEGKSQDGLEELKDAFPEIKSYEDLPESVLENAKLKGTLLLDEYLRYLLGQNKILKAAAQKQKENELSSTGPLVNLKGANNPETEEFLRGLWK